MKRLHFALFSFILLLGGVSCTDDRAQEADDQPIDNGDNIAVTLKLSVPGILTAGTYALTGQDENAITTVDILVFLDNGAGNETFLYNTHATNINNAGGSSLKSFTANLQKSNGADKHRIVLLNNLRDAVDAVKATLTTAMTKQEVMDKISFASNIKWNTTSSANFTALPMWGEALASHTITSTSTGTQLGTIKMLRSIARVDIGLKIDATGVAQGLAEFKIEDVKVYNTNNKGAAAPKPGNMAAGIAALPTLPAAVAVNTPALAYSQTPAGDGLIREIYIAEAENKTKTNTANITCLVVGGYYSKPGDPVNTTKKTWYRIDFYDRTNLDPNKQLDILRNHSYRVNITQVDGEGYGTETEAFNSKPLNMKTEITAWDQGEMNDITFDGQYQLAVDKSELTFFMEGREQELTVFTDHPDGWEIKAADIPAWLTITPTSDVSGNALTIKVEADPILITDPTRPDEFIITAGKLKKKIKVTQLNEPELTIDLSTDLIVFRKSGSSAKSVTVTSFPTGAVRFVSSSGDVTWATGASPADYDGTNLTSFSFQPTANTQNKVLNSIVTVSVREGSKIAFKNITIKQLATDLLFNITGKPVAYPAIGGASSFSVESEAPYQLSTDGVSDPENMLTLSTTAELPANLAPVAFPFSLTPNPYYDTERVAKIYAQSSDIDFPVQEIEIKQLAQGPYLKLNGVDGNYTVDFGTPTTNTAQTVTVNSNSGWQAVANPNYLNVLASWSPALGSTVAGSIVPTIGLDNTITIAANSAHVGFGAAGTQYSENFNIETRNHGTAPTVTRTITVKRKVQGAFIPVGTLPAHNSKWLAHTGEDVIAYANTNMKWYVGSNVQTAISQEASAYAENKTQTISIPGNYTWGDRTVSVSVAYEGVVHWDISTFPQAGWNLNTNGAHNMPLPIPAAGGDWVVNTQTSTSTPAFRIGVAVGWDSEVWQWYDAVPSPAIGDRSFHVPPNNSAAARQISVRIERAGLHWFTAVNTTQAKRYGYDNKVGTFISTEEAFPVTSVRHAINLCDALNIGGFSDWRLPNKSELWTLVDHWGGVGNFDKYYPMVYASSTYKQTSSGADWYWGVTWQGGWMDTADKLDGAPYGSKINAICIRNI